MCSTLDFIFSHPDKHIYIPLFMIMIIWQFKVSPVAAYTIAMTDRQLGYVQYLAFKFTLAFPIRHNDYWIGCGMENQFTEVKCVDICPPF